MQPYCLKTFCLIITLSLTAAFSFAADTPLSVVKGAARTQVAGTTAKAAKRALIDINTATEAQLKAVPGIGTGYAAKIIAGRPYAKKDQLKSRHILPGPVYDQVKEGIIAKQPLKPVLRK